MGSVIAVPITMALTLISTRPSDIITYCKWLVSYIYIEVSRRMGKKRLDLYDMEAIHAPFKTGFLPPQLEYDLESPQSESHLSNAADEVFFYGVNAHSECLITRLARTVNDEAEAWIYLKLSDEKVYQLKETAGYQHSCSDNGREFTCGGLRINYAKPMRRWRIFYNGLLKETSEQDETSNRMVYIKFALIWRASSDCFDMTSDVNSSALAMGFAKSKWKSFKPPLKKLNDALDFYAQSGTIMGTVQVAEEISERNLYLFGERTRYLGETSLEEGVEFVHILGQVSKTGCIFHIAEATIPGVVTKLQYGFVVSSAGQIAPISDKNPVMENVGAGKDIRAVFHADGLEFEVKGSVDGKRAHFESKKGWDGSLSIDKLNIDVNYLDGSGVLIKGKIFKPSKRKTLQKKEKESIKAIPMAVHFSEDVCEVSEATGGKGSSLGKLTRLSKDLQNFIVPNGIVVTTSAYEEFMNENIFKEIRNLEQVLYGNVSGDIKDECQRVMDEVVKAKIPEKVHQSTVKCLQKAFGDQFQTKKFAIRSSATGEDTEQMSAAGQMETYLGVTGLSEIMNAVKKCWASQFGFVAVQYKKQNGQVINSSMAVVIQEMISCDVAGVLFTCDPLTGNPSKMSITANYGLGESVVSGSEEPDTITLARNEKEELEIKEKNIGAKSHRIVIKEDEGTRLEEVTENEKNACCLDDTLALRLGNIAIQIEKHYRSNRDIEWGFWNQNLYIFQSRPVTSGTEETDYEIDHEMDCPMRIENDFFTVCNVGEVMPGAMSPLGLDIMFKYFAISMQRGSISDWRSQITPKYFPKGICNMYNHVMFYTVDFLEQINEGKEVIDAMMVALFGRILDDEELYEVARERYGRKPKKPMLIKQYRFIRGLRAPTFLHKRAQKRYLGYRIPVEQLKTSQEAFDYMVKICDDCHEAMAAHMVSSQASSIWNMMILSTIGKSRGGIDSTAYSDFSRLLSSISGVESADVPSAMQSLAFHIGKEIKPEEIKKMESEDIEKWLQSSPSEAGIKFRDFLSKHGHRCLKEFDIRSTTWGADPKILINLLKNLVGCVQDSETKTPENPSDIMSGLQLGFKERMALKFMLPRCRSAVQTREATKSLTIKALDCWRKGYRHLAKLMVSEGRIPDEDLLYFMYLEEIKELLSNRSPRIISKANHRRRRHPELDRYIFPELMKGLPQPVNLIDAPTTPTADNFMMKGIPVSRGVARGFVRVALNLEEASKLKPGEILLTYSTDIGWTPYFPALAGVVTELGGLISHGAVVSREYGLPCIAGLHGATRQFHTGDYVLLDGNKGILQKISPPES